MGIAIEFRRRMTGTLLALALGMMSSGCASARPDTGKPRPEIFDQEVIKIELNYRAKEISVVPESVKIYLQWDDDRRDAHRPVQARWVVEGLKRGHTVFIFPKKDSPRVEFPYPTEYQGQRAFSIDGKNNSIRSGEPRAFPGLEKGKGYSRREGKDYKRGGKPIFAKWNYDVAVVNEDGEELFRVDPQIIVVGHP
ncbi:MAG: hypothetical protein K0U98_13265 [Deltaproteobacteria bacterium]|nr:hypothetical protein [Deltaproteobacteria bacterium]